MGTDTLLISSIGISNYKPTTYSLEGVGDCETALCPLALAELLDIDTAFIPRTAEAVEQDEKLKDGFDVLNVSYEFETIPKISEQDDANEVLTTLINHIRELDPASIVLDITYGYRSLPMVLFSSVMYLNALGEVDIEGIYYGEYQDDESTIIDLTYLHTLMEWHHALRTFETTGSLRAVHQLFDSRREQGFKRGEELHNFAEVVKPLSKTSRSFDSGLPLEAGRAVRNTIDALDEIDENQFVGPEGGFIDPLTNELRGFEVDQDTRNKTEIELTMDELIRQRKYIKFYLDTERYWLALECARELFLNRLLYESDIHDRENWLNRETRKEMKNDLNGEGKDRHTEKEPLKLWDRIGNHRNIYAHSGFKRKEVPSETKVKNTLTKLCKNIDNDEFWEEIV